MKVLVIAAHPDDEILGCGGTIERLKKERHDVFIVILGQGRGTFDDNTFDGQPLLNWVEKVEADIEVYEPDIIFTHYEKDLNIDHQITYKAVITACRPIRDQNIVREIYSFEVVSNTEWSISEFQPDTFYDIGQHIAAKIQKMQELYYSEMRKWPHPRSIMGIRYLALYRGMQCGVEYAEAFKCIRRLK